MTSNIRILFIDEEKENYDRLLDYLDKTTLTDEICFEYKPPLRTLEEMIQAILESNPNALVVDYRLNEDKREIKYTVPYTGISLLQEFRNIKEGFPCFVLTSYDHDAQVESDDVNIVYEKSLLNDSDSKFLDKVKLQVVKYKSLIRNNTEEFRQLMIKKMERVLTLDEELRLIYLDTFIEKTRDGRASIPSELKETSNLEKLDQLIAKTDEILKILEDGHNK